MVLNSFLVFVVAGRGADGDRDFLILMLQRRGQKPLEKVIGGLLLLLPRLTLSS
ncbi:hypothetical protein ACNKHT_15555 [Shigella flexneri]